MLSNRMVIGFRDCKWLLGRIMQPRPGLRFNPNPVTWCLFLLLAWCYLPFPYPSRFGPMSILYNPDPKKFKICQLFELQRLWLVTKCSKIGQQRADRTEHTCLMGSENLTTWKQTKSSDTVFYQAYIYMMYNLIRSKICIHRSVWSLDKFDIRSLYALCYLIKWWFILEITHRYIW